jgi:hypothetical protein
MFMKKIFLASMIVTSSLFAAPTTTTGTATATPIPVVKATVADTAQVAPVDTAKIAIAPIADTTKAVVPPVADTTKTVTVPVDTAKVVAIPVVADTAKSPLLVDTTKVAPVKAPKTVTPKAPVEANVMAAPGSEAVAIKTPVKEEAKKAPLYTGKNFSLDLNASFEIQAGKTLWTSEDDEDGHNLEEWWGRANFGVVTKADDFEGKLLVFMYPGDLQGNEVNVREDGDTSYAYRDLFEIHEAWVLQHTEFVNFKLGRWEFTQKNGDFFGDYVDGYYKGFKSGLNSENAIEFALNPTENMSVDLAFISNAPHLNKGDLRLMFHFRELAGIEALNLDLGYSNNIFDEIYASDENDVRHTISLQAKTPLLPGAIYLFIEGALMNLDAEEEYTYVDPKTHLERTKTRSVDMVTPITGGLLFTPKDYRVILEAEYIANRDETEFADDNKHVKDVLGAFYIEKPLTKRFTLSFGAHSYGSSKDFAFTGNLLGTIN